MRVVLRGSLAAAAVIAATAASHSAYALGQAPNQLVIQDGACYVGASGSSFCYDPPALTTATGTTVTWLNRSGFPHTITRCQPSVCNGVSGGTGGDNFGDAHHGITKDEQYSFTFRQPGTYVYYCRIHGYAGMHGVVVVSGGGLSAAPGAAGSAIGDGASTLGGTSPARGGAASGVGQLRQPNAGAAATAIDANRASAGLGHFGSSGVALISLLPIAAVLGGGSYVVQRRRRRLKP
jgi:plastocyanin